jgi:hypothetical protein
MKHVAENADPHILYPFCRVLWPWYLQTKRAVLGCQPFDDVEFPLPNLPTPEWRNWQTHQTQNLTKRPFPTH